MYKIYFNDSLIYFSQSLPQELNGNNDVTIENGYEFTKLLEKVKNTKIIAVLSDKFEDFFSDFSSNTLNIIAAGGLVKNPSGEILMIFRNGKWDLPKGKMEGGESPEQCAVREVSEECSVPMPELGDKITVTSHLYYLDNRLILKNTHWYRMYFDTAQESKPQTEEGITEVKWVEESKLDLYLKTHMAQ